METIIKCGWTRSWPIWRCGKEAGILPHNYFPWKDLNFTSRKERTSEPDSDGVGLLQQHIFCKSALNDKQHTYQPISQSIEVIVKKVQHKYSDYMEIMNRYRQKSLNQVFCSSRSSPFYYKTLNIYSPRCCLPSTDASDRRGKICVCVWRSKFASCKGGSFKSTRVSQNKIR